MALYVIAELGAKSKIPANIGPFLGIVLGLALVAHMANRWLVPDANAVILPLAALLNGIGYVVIARWNPPARPRAGGVGRPRRRALRRSRSSWSATRATSSATATSCCCWWASSWWRHCSSARSTGPACGSTSAALEFQPIEFSKILLCIFFASYFAANKEMLSIPTARLGNRLVLDPRPLIPILVAWGAAMAVIGLEDDIGFAALLFVLFIGMLWVTTGRVGYLVLGFVLFVGGADHRRPLLRPGPLPGRPVAQPVADSSPTPTPVRSPA